jgi:hypothetical protein
MPGVLAGPGGYVASGHIIEGRVPDVDVIRVVGIHPAMDNRPEAVDRRSGTGRRAPVGTAGAAGPVVEAVGTVSGSNTRFGR